MFQKNHKPERQVLITFDYELFLGEWSGTVDACMINPTNQILLLLDKYSMKSIFFVDSTYLYFLQEAGKIYEKAEKDFIKIREQLQGLIKKGHTLYLHIHPHWKDAQYHPDKNQWSCTNSKNFSIGNLSPEERTFIFDNSYRVLKEICDFNLSQKIQGFRAGGLFIQPFEHFIPHFEKHSIKYDFSVLCGFSGKGNQCSYDFSKIDKKEIYSFQNEASSPDINGLYTEFPISVIIAGLKTKILNSLWYRIHKKNSKVQIWGDGIPTKNKIVSKEKVNKLKIKESASIENLNKIKLEVYIRYIKFNTFMHFISHPKFLAPMHLNIFEKFIQSAHNKYTIISDIKEILEKTKKNSTV